MKDPKSGVDQKEEGKKEGVCARPDVQEEGASRIRQAPLTTSGASGQHT